MRSAILLACLLCTIEYTFSQSKKIDWISFEEAVKRNETNPKKIIVDVYTDWCGWCKRMDANTFTNPAIVRYIKEKYWAVKLNAERKDTVKLGSQIFVNENLDRKRGPHQLAIALLNGKMTYPSIVYLDESVELMHPAIAGYQDAKSLEEIINYFGENAYQSIPWDKFQNTFKSKIGLEPKKDLN